MTMVRHLPIYKKQDGKEMSQYRRLSLLELIMMIVMDGDRYALDELHHNRPIFLFKNHPGLLFIQYMKHLKQVAQNTKGVSSKSIEVINHAFDLVLDKFSNLPLNQKNDRIMKQKGSNCRLYFKALLIHIEKRLTNDPVSDPLEEEAFVATIFKGFVRRHFYLSYLEALRQSDVLFSRYRWDVNNGHMWLRLPKTLSSNRPGEWLAKHVGAPQLFHPKDKDEVQEKVDQLYQKPIFARFDENLSINDAIPVWNSVNNSFNTSLAATVANEKALNIEKQRKTICALGPDQLKKMILRIFKDIYHDEYHCSDIAGDYGLSKASFSRFAGSNWNMERIPDLWHNTAYVLAQNSEFRDIAKDAGVLQKIQAVQNTKR